MQLKNRTRFIVGVLAVVLSILAAPMDFASLTAPGRVALAQTGTFCVTDDTRVEQLHPDTNYGGDLRVEVDTIHPISGRLERIITYLRFDLSSLPPGSTLTSVQFNITVRSSGTGGTQFPINVHSTSADWSQGTLTWNNQPGLGPVLAVMPAPMLPGNLVSVSLPTSFFTGPGPYALALAFPEQDNHSDGIDFVTLEDPTSDAIACLDVAYTTSGALNQPPILAPIADQTLMVGQTVDLPIAVTDENPPGVVLIGSSGNGAVLSAFVIPGPYLRLRGVGPGTTTASVSANDLVNPPASITFNVTVNPELAPPPPPPPAAPPPQVPPPTVPPPTDVPPVTELPPIEPPPATPTAEPSNTPEPPGPQPTQDPDVPVYTEADHRRAQAPLCMDLSGQATPGVRAIVPDGAVNGGFVHCRVLARDGVFPNPADPGRIGDPGLIEYGVITAVDVFGVDGIGLASQTFAHEVTICLEGSGRFIYLSALNSPRTTFEMPSFEEDGYTCAAIPAAGTVVLIPPVPQN